MNRSITVAIPVIAIVAIILTGNRKHSRVDVPGPLPESKRESPVGPRKPDRDRRVMNRILSGEIRDLSPLQIDRFLEARDYDAPSLLAAWQLTGEDFWLDKAADEHPDDPRVAVAMLSRDGELEGIDWIERLKTNDPENGATSLFGALADFSLGDVESALGALSKLESLPETTFYTKSMATTIVEAFEHGGYGELEAEFAGTYRIGLPFMTPMRELNRAIATNMERALETGNSALAKSLGEAGIAAASRMSGETENNYLLNQLVTVSMERNILHRMDSFELVQGDRMIAAERLADLDNEVEEIKNLLEKSHDSLVELTDSEAGKYSRVLRKEGEEKALQWLIKKDRRSNHDAF